ncbi:MAG: hypothetical protein ABWY00_06435 [Dongiaceae bacterium]
MAIDLHPIRASAAVSSLAGRQIMVLLVEPCHILAMLAGDE